MNKTEVFGRIVNGLSAGSCAKTMRFFLCRGRIQVTRDYGGEKCRDVPARKICLSRPLVFVVELDTGGDRFQRKGCKICASS